jgi:hypothetical protein
MCGLSDKAENENADHVMYNGGGDCTRSLQVDP